MIMAGLLSHPKNEPKPPKDGETVTFKAGRNTYTVYNTKAHIRILAERLGLELCKSEYRKMPVWDGCNGYPVGENRKILYSKS